MGGAAMAGNRSGNRDQDGRVRFGRLLADALKVRGMKQEHLAGMLGTTQSSVSGWINGKYEPAATTVFRIERALALEPGHLSRPLGYLPVEAASSSVSVEGAIFQSAALDDEEKGALVALYHVLVDRRARGAGQQGPATTAVSSARSRLASAPTGATRQHSVAGNR